MNGKGLIAMLAVLAAIQGGVFAWVIRVENRLAKIETTIDLRLSSAPPRRAP